LFYFCWLNLCQAPAKKADKKSWDFLLLNQRLCLTEKTGGKTAGNPGGKAGKKLEENLALSGAAPSQKKTQMLAKQDLRTSLKKRSAAYGLHQISRKEASAVNSL